MNLSTVYTTLAVALVLSVVPVYGERGKDGRRCQDSGVCKVKDYCNTVTGRCERMLVAGQECNKSRQCKGSSTCELAPYGAPVKRCTERCRTDNDCRVHGKNKYCTSGGLKTLVKGYCKPQKQEGADCSRSPQCLKDLYCKNSKCKEAEEAVQCELDCNGPREKNPENIKAGDTVNVTYSCTFVRTGEFGPLNISVKMFFNKKVIKEGEFRLRKGESPLTISGSRAIFADRGEFSAEIQGIMRGCKNHRNVCRATRRCILKA